MITGILIALAIIVAIYFVYQNNKKKKAKLKEELNAQIESGTGTMSGAATANVKPDTSYDATADVNAVLDKKGYWLTDDDEQGIFNIIKNLGTKAKLKAFRNKFQEIKGRDFEDWLYNHVGLDAQEQKQYSSIINSLS